MVDDHAAKRTDRGLAAKMAAYVTDALRIAVIVMGTDRASKTARGGVWTAVQVGSILRRDGSRRIRKPPYGCGIVAGRDLAKELGVPAFSR